MSSVVLLELAIAEQPGVARGEQVLRLHALELSQAVAERAFEQRRHLLGIAMRAAERFGNDLVDRLPAPSIGAR